MRLRLLFWLVTAATASGCVTIYQPVSGFQRPTIVDPAAPNFEGLRLRVRCVPTEGADQGESDDLCQNLQALYTNQGAKVDIEVPEEGGAVEAREEPLPEDDAQGKPAPPGKADLIIELKARRVHWENSPLLWALCYASLTLIPAITEATYAQDVNIRDADGFLLVSDTMSARFIRYFGLGYWAINGILDLFVRPKGEELIGNNHKRDFSRDFHGQMSQLAFHALMRSKILKSFEPDQATAEAPPPAPPKAPRSRPGQPAEPQLSPPPPPPSRP